MAKILPKGKKVTGTKKKDKIVSTGKGVWKKALTVNAGKGNDVINFKKSNYKNTLNGQDGKDTIYGGKKNDKITGGAGNDIINAGKGDNTIYLNKNEGTDTIENGGGTDTLVFSDETDFSNFSFTYSGNDLNISATGTTAKLQNFASGNYSAKYLKAGNDTFDLSLLKGLTSGTVKLGTNSDDVSALVAIFNRDSNWQAAS